MDSGIHYLARIQNSRLSLNRPSHRAIFCQNQGAKKIIFTACHSGKLKLAYTSPDVISTSPKNVLTSRTDFTVLLLIEFLKFITCPSGKLKTEFTSPGIGHYFLCTMKTKRIRKKLFAHTIARADDKTHLIPVIDALGRIAKRSRTRCNKLCVHCTV